MENHESFQYRPTFPASEMDKFLYEYGKKKTRSLNDKYSVTGQGLYDILKSDEKTVEEEIQSIEHQIAEREKIKRRNVIFLEEQRQKLEEFLNRTECWTYKPSGIINAVRSRLATQLVQVDLKKGEEYVNAFKDVQRLEEQKRKLLSEEKADQGWSEWS